MYIKLYPSDCSLKNHLRQKEMFKAVRFRKNRVYGKNYTL